MWLHSVSVRHLALLCLFYFISEKTLLIIMTCHSSKKVSFPGEIISHTGLEVVRFLSQLHHHEMTYILQGSEWFLLKISPKNILCSVLCRKMMEEIICEEKKSFTIKVNRKQFSCYNFDMNWKVQINCLKMSTTAVRIFGWTDYRWRVKRKEIANLGG